MNIYISDWNISNINMESPSHKLDESFFKLKYANFKKQYFQKQI